MNYKDIETALKAVKTVNIHGKEYVEVNQRIKAFRQIIPEGFIMTEILSEFEGVITMKATVGFYAEGRAVVLATGTAREVQGASNINRTSHLENCETSAVGRALGMLGIGVDGGVASADEVSNAISQQGERKATPKQVAFIEKLYQGENLQNLLQAEGVTAIGELSIGKASEIIGAWKEQNGNY